MECNHFQYAAFLKSKQPVKWLVLTEVNSGGNGKLGFQNKGERKDRTMYSGSDKHRYISLDNISTIQC